MPIKCVVYLVAFEKIKLMSVPTSWVNLYISKRFLVVDSKLVYEFLFRVVSISILATPEPNRCGFSKTWPVSKVVSRT